MPVLIKVDLEAMIGLSKEQALLWNQINHLKRVPDKAGDKRRLEKRRLFLEQLPNCTDMVNLMLNAPNYTTYKHDMGEEMAIVEGEQWHLRSSRSVRVVSSVFPKVVAWS